MKPDGKTVVIRHEEVPDYMPAMTMPFEVKDRKELAGLKPGDEVSFRMLVTETEGWIDQVTRLRETDPGEPPPRETFRRARMVEPLEIGDPIPDYPFTNELGRAFSLGQFKGKALALTFIFTRFPFPNFCPRMSENFAGAYRQLASRPDGPTNWHLLSLSFDPEFDTPATLKNFLVSSIASSFELASRIAKPPITSFDSMNGPSVTVTLPPASLTRAPRALGRHPSVATSTPAMAGPTMRAPLSIDEFSAMALMRSSLPTISITKVCRVGRSIEFTTPRSRNPRSGAVASTRSFRVFPIGSAASLISRTKVRKVSITLPKPSTFSSLVRDLSCRRSRVKISGAVRILRFSSSLSKKNSICFEPSPSMSKALRETKCFRCSTACARQTKPPVQRRTASTLPVFSLISRTAWLPQTGHVVGNL